MEKISGILGSSHRYNTNKETHQVARPGAGRFGQVEASRAPARLSRTTLDAINDLGKVNAAVDEHMSKVEMARNISDGFFMSPIQKLESQVQQDQMPVQVEPANPEDIVTIADGDRGQNLSVEA